YDADALIVNRDAQDSTFSIEQLKDLMTDTVASKYQVLLDGDNATSSVRFLLDSITGDQGFGVNVKGAKGSKDVLDNVASDKNVIGFVGSSWILGSEIGDKYRDRVKLAYVECKRCDDGTFAKPSQATLYEVQYPLVRPLFGILKDAGIGLGASFYNFMSYERGQLIFRRGELVPGKMNFVVRKVVNKPDQDSTEH